MTLLFGNIRGWMCRALGCKWEGTLIQFRDGVRCGYRCRRCKAWRAP